MGKEKRKTTPCTRKAFPGNARRRAGHRLHFRQACLHVPDEGGQPAAPGAGGGGPVAVLPRVAVAARRARPAQFPAAAAMHPAPGPAMDRRRPAGRARPRPCTAAGRRAQPRRVGGDGFLSSAHRRLLPVFRSADGPFSAKLDCRTAHPKKAHNKERRARFSPNAACRRFIARNQRITEKPECGSGGSENVTGGAISVRRRKAVDRGPIQYGPGLARSRHSRSFALKISHG